MLKIKGGRWLFPRLDYNLLIGKHGILHSSLILNPDVDFSVRIVSEVPLVVLLPGFFLGGRCFIFLHLVWIDIVDLLGGLRDRKLLITVSTRSPSDSPSSVSDASSSSSCSPPTPIPRWRTDGF
jgi:hypothetical protein